MPYVWDPDLEEVVVGITGPRGGGKTILAAYIASIHHLIREQPVRSNLPIYVPLHNDHDGVLFKSEDLDTMQLFTLSQELTHGAVLIDELNLWFSARRSMTKKNELFNDIMQQVRKRALSLIYTVQSEMWVDPYLRFQTDMFMKLFDLRFSQWGKEQNVRRGIWFDVLIEDWSGCLTGHRYYEQQAPLKVTFYGPPVWRIVDSYQQQDVFEAMANIQVDQPKMQIAVGRDEEVEQISQKYGWVFDTIETLRNNGTHIIDRDDLWATLGVETNQQKIDIGKVLGYAGVRKRAKANGRYNYYLTPDWSPNPANVSVTE